MKIIIKFTLMVLMLFNFSFPQTKGRLVIIGGGKKPEYLMKKFIELAGGEKSKIIIIPNASGVPMEEYGYEKEEFVNAGCKNINYLYCNREEANADSSVEKLNDITGVYFSGGDQSFLTRDLLGTKLLAKIKDIYEKGGVVGGTSAGAAVMSKVMITGNELLNKDSTQAFIEIKKNNIETVEGFGFIKRAIIDQHFLKRKRHNRLISVVLEHPDLIGVAIDESTSIIVNPDHTFKVLGENQVLIYDATNAKDISTDKNGNLSAYNLKMHLLKSGEGYNLETKSVIE